MAKGREPSPVILLGDGQLAGLAATVGLVYFLAALLSYGLALQSEGLAVFWPASGISSGFLIAFGSRARWPVESGVVVAVLADHLIMADPLRVGIAFALSDAAETLIIAGLIERYFGAEFRQRRQEINQADRGGQPNASCPSPSKITGEGSLPLATC